MVLVKEIVMAGFLVKYSVHLDDYFLFDYKDDFRLSDVIDSLWISNYSTYDNAMNAAAEQVRIMANTFRLCELDSYGDVAMETPVPIPSYLWRGIIISLCFVGEFFACDKSTYIVEELLSKYRKDYGEDMNRYITEHLAMMDIDRYIVTWKYNFIYPDGRDGCLSGVIQIIPHEEGDDVVDVFERMARMFI